jgi:peptidase S41-like protein
MPLPSTYLPAFRSWLPFLLVILGPSFLAVGSVQSQFLADSTRVAGWRSDISYYLEQMRRQHYTYRFRPLPSGMIDAADRLSRNVPHYSDERILAEFAHLASFAGDGHTYVLPFGSRRVTAHMLPLRFFLFNDGMYIIDAFPGYQKWIGSRVVRVGDSPAEDVIERMRPALSADNRFTYLWVAPALLSFQGYLENFADGIRSDSVALTLRPIGGRDLRVKIAPVVAPPMRGIPKLLPSRVSGAPTPPLYLSNISQNFWIEPLPDSVLYVQFNQVMNAEKEPLAAFAAKLDKALTDTRPHAVIVDVRHNNGGNLTLLPPLLEAFRHYEQANERGRIYVLMGRNTFSAAQVFLAQMDRDTRAIFAGEPSSSRPNFVGEETPVQLPWSGAIGSISDEYHETIPGDKREWIEPDIKLTLSSRDYFANRDPLLEKVLAIAKKRP